ncbi:hypothetical protein GCM10023213_42720 [Prosthecobacter algae]|uniref:Uncharacterized protein n=1 Tax=Prosthecobacter algae TaxID=1144682 RepID=A0ABP9PKK9_9BACT
MNAIDDSWEEKYGAPESVGSFYFYFYEYIDFYDFLKPAVDVLQGWSQAELFIEALKKGWLERGWAGDGLVTAIWLPPFCVEELNSTNGHILWHVKQLEDGFSWLASRHPLPFLGDPLPVEDEPDEPDDSWMDDLPLYRPRFS